MATASPLSTVRDLLRLAVSRFTQAGLSFGHGTDNAYDEAVYLILHTLHLPLDTLDPFLDARLLPDEIAAVMEVIRRRVDERVPAAYITHEAYMHGQRFYVDERVIVPRSFIGELLQDGLAPWVSDIDAIGPVLELCTGSGCLPILAAQAWPHASIDAVDISADALIMSLLGGVQTVTGPIVGGAVFTFLKAYIMPLTDQWRLVLGAIIILLVLVFPRGIVGFFNARLGWLGGARQKAPPAQREEKLA